MKKLTPFVLVFLLVLFLVVTTQSLADGERGKENRLSSVAIVPGDRPVPSAMPMDVTTLTTDFEAAEGFSPGYCAQNGWTAFTVSNIEGHISTVNPSSGVQHLRVGYDQALGNGTLVGCFSPNIGPQSVEPVWMEVDVAISGDGGADYFVNPQSPTQGYTTARVVFDWLGNIWIGDDPGSGFQMVDTGIAWNIGPYTTLRIEVDPDANTIKYYYGGDLIYTGVVFAGTTIEQVVLYHDNWNLADWGDFDNLVVDRYNWNLYLPLVIR